MAGRQPGERGSDFTARLTSGSSRACANANSDVLKPRLCSYEGSFATVPEENDSGSGVG